MERIKRLVSYPRVKAREKWINGPLKKFYESLTEIRQNMKEEDNLELLADLVQNASSFQDSLLKYKHLGEFSKIKQAIECLNEESGVVKNYNIKGFDKKKLYLEVDQFFVSPQPMSYLLSLQRQDMRRIAANKIAKEFMSKNVQHLLNTIKDHK